MPGKLDAISEAIGRLRASVADIQRRMDDIHELQARCHQENRDSIAEVTNQIREFDVRCQRCMRDQEAIRPTLAALELSRSKLTTWASIGFAAVVLLGWVVEAALKWAVAWMLSHFQ